MVFSAVLLLLTQIFSVSALSYFHYIHSPTCSLANITGISSCIDDPLGKMGKVIQIPSTPISTKNVNCSALCKVYLRVYSKTNQQILVTYSPRLDPNGWVKHILTSDKWDIISFSLANPGGAFNITLSNTNSLVASDILVADFVTSDESGLSTLEKQNLFLTTQYWYRLKYLQSLTSYDLNSGPTILNIAGQIDPNSIRMCNNKPIIGGQNQMTSFQKTGPNSFVLNFSSIGYSHFKARVTMEIYAIDKWSGEFINLLVNNTIHSISRYNDTSFTKNINCGNTGKYIISTETIEFDVPSATTSVIVRVVTDSIQNDSISSFGFRNVLVDVFQCPSLAKTCTGPTYSESTECVDNSVFFLGTCQCLLNYIQSSDYTCAALPNTDDVCPAANMRFWSITVVNYNCSYDEATENHILFLRYISYYDKLTKCLNFTLYSTNNPSYKMQFTISQDPLFNYFQILFKTLDMENFFLCSINNSINSIVITYRCRFTFESYYQNALLTYSFFVYEFQLNRITQDTLSFYSSPILIKVIDCCCQTANNEGYCIDNSVYKSRADMCTDETCNNYENNINFNYTQKLFFQHSIINTTLSQYTLNVTDLTFTCDGIFTKMRIENQKYLPGRTIIQTSSILTGKCIISIRSSIIAYVSTISRVLVDNSSNSSAATEIMNGRALVDPSSNIGVANENYLIGLLFERNMTFNLKNLQTTREIENDDSSKKIMIIVVSVVVGSVLVIGISIGFWYLKKRVKKFTSNEQFDRVPTSV